MEIDVELHEVSIGSLDVGRSGGATFQFHESYVDRPAGERAVLGQAFEDRLRETWRATNRLPEFFSNLLPEGTLRQLVAMQAGVPEHHEARLLLRLGQDLPGAITVAPLTELDEQELPQRADPTAIAGDTPLRFSLAGVQAKFSVLRNAEKFTFPARGFGGDWIVKLPDLAFAGVPENEFSMMTWAERAGIAVPSFQLVDTESIDGLPDAMLRARIGPAYAVERFDRSAGERIHIEDFAQVFSVYPEAKYSLNFESIANVIANVCDEGSLREYFRRLVFMVVSGNADMHLKNWSLRYGRQVELSPAYDMVSTVVYPDVVRELALKFSRSKNFDAVDLDHFRHMFDRIDRDPDDAEEWLAEDLERVLTAWADVRDQLPLSSEARAAIEDHQQRLLLVKQFRLRSRR
jgi:serine/threonine-protein kinase HipA